MNQSVFFQRRRKYSVPSSGILVSALMYIEGTWKIQRQTHLGFDRCRRTSHEQTLLDHMPELSSGETY